MELLAQGKLNSFIIARRQIFFAHSLFCPVWMCRGSTRVPGDTKSYRESSVQSSLISSVRTTFSTSPEHIPKITPIIHYCIEQSDTESLFWAKQLSRSYGFI